MEGIMPEIRIGDTQYQLSDGITVVGRSNEADLTIESSKLSRMHARFTVKGNEITIEDLDSKNGVFINGSKLDKPHIITENDTVLIADLNVQVALPVSTPADKPKAVQKKKNGAERNAKRPRPEKNKSMAPLIITGTIVLVCIIVSVVLGSKKPEGLEEARALLVQAETGFSNISVQDSLEENNASLQELGRIRSGLGTISSEFQSEHRKAETLLKKIEALASDINRKNSELSTAKTAADRFNAVMNEISNTDLSANEKIRKLEQYASVFPNTEQASAALSKISDVKREARNSEKLSIRSAKAEADRLVLEDKYKEAIAVLEAATSQVYTRLSADDIKPLKDAAAEIKIKAGEHVDSQISKILQRAKTEKGDVLITELNTLYDNIGLTDFKPNVDKAVSEIREMNKARLAEVFKALEKEFAEIESLAAKRLYIKAENLYDSLLPRVTDQSLKDSIQRKRNINHLYAVAKKAVMTFVNKEKGCRLEGTGFIEKMQPEKVYFSIDGTPMPMGWDKIRDDEFKMLAALAVNESTDAELFTAYGYILLDNKRTREAETWFQKALSASPQIESQYPVLFRELKERIAVRIKAEAEERERLAAEKAAKQSAVDTDMPWEEYTDKTPWVTGNKIYVATNGSDKSSGSSPALPMKTVTAAVAKAGSGKSVLLRRGDTFYEDNITVSSGTVISAYGPENLPRPRIAGSVRIQGWKKYRGNIYVAPVQQNIDHLFVNSRIMTIARYPNDGWLFPITGTDPSRSPVIIKCPDLADNPRNSPGYWKGANVRWRRWSWWFETLVISDWDGHDTLKISQKLVYNISNCVEKGKAGGIYLDNKLEELDMPGEWYFDIESKQVYLWAPDNDDPNTLVVEGMCKNLGMTVQSAKVEKIEICHFRKKGMNVSRADTYIRDCLFRGNLDIALYGGVSSANTRIHGNIFEDNLNVGIRWHNTDNNPTCYIEYNVLRRVGAIPGYGGSGTWHAVGILQIHSAGLRIRYNLIEDTGYAGILLGGGGTHAEYNIIKRAMCTMNDGAGIYTNCNNSFVTQNIILDTEGDLESSMPWYPLGHGIWCEFLSDFKGMQLKGNICAGNGANGIFFPNNFDGVVEDNICYDNEVAQMFLEGFAANSHSGRTRKLPYNCKVNNNIFFACKPEQIGFRFRPDHDYGSMSGNWFIKLDSNEPIEQYGRGSSKWTRVAHTIKSFVAKFGRWTDKQAKGEGFKMKNPLLVINDTPKVRDIPLAGSWVDLEGKGYKGTITLEPFTGKIVFGPGGGPGKRVLYSELMKKK